MLIRRSEVSGRRGEEWEARAVGERWMARRSVGSGRTGGRSAGATKRLALWPTLWLNLLAQRHASWECKYCMHGC